MCELVVCIGEYGWVQPYIREHFVDIKVHDLNAQRIKSSLQGHIERQSKLIE